ncbi:MAG: serine hydrolase domain-containing protein [Marinicella sp.]
MTTIKIITLMLSLATISSIQPAQAKNIGPDTSHLSSLIDQYVNQLYIQQKFIGSILVAHQGKVIINKHYGTVGVDKQNQIVDQSVFEVASLTKAFTATLTMMIKQDGLLQLDDSVNRFLPHFPYPNITVRHLLSHTSGLSENLFFQWAGKNMDPRKIYSNEMILKYLNSVKPKLQFNPGDQFEYSNVGYMILPLILKNVTGQSYIHLLNERIINPLQMHQTGIYPQTDKASKMNNYVFGQMFNSKHQKLISTFGMAWSDAMYGGVGILSNTNDLFKWDQALYSNHILDEASLSEMFSPYQLNNGEYSKYGLGWFVYDQIIINDKNIGTQVFHHGLWPGYESLFTRLIDHQLTIIILSSLAPSTNKDINDQIIDLMVNTLIDLKA